MVTRVGITFEELRRIVIALHETGALLKRKDLTFSHGNIGNEFQDLARSLDAFVVDLEQRNKLVLVKAEEMESTDEHHRELRNIIREWQRFGEELGQYVGQGTTDDMLKAVAKLKNEVLQLRAKGRPNKKAKK